MRLGPWFELHRTHRTSPCTVKLLDSPYRFAQRCLKQNQRKEAALSIVEQFYTGLKAALPAPSLDELSFATGASSTQLASLKEVYPLCPDSLLQLLGKINGTHWEKYEKGEVSVLILGSDISEYPYYLRSVEQILEDRAKNDQSIADVYGDDFLENPDMLDRRIDPDVVQGERLCFSYCMNNGGTSTLFIDFAPTASGKVGQVIRFVHDPDEFVVIADSFDAYLQMLVDDKFGFILED